MKMSIENKGNLTKSQIYIFQKHLNNPVDVHAKKIFTMLPKTPLMTRKKKKKRLTHLEELEEHTFTVQ